MGLMEKFKNLFTDEEIIEDEEPVKIKEIKKDEEKTKEHKLPTFMREKIEKEEKEKKEKKEKKTKNTKEKKEKEEQEEEKEKESVNEDFKPMDANLTEEKPNKFKFPVFEESDFIEPTRASRHVKQEIDIDVEEEIKPINHTNIIEKEEAIKTETKVSKLYKDKIEPPEEIKRFKASPIISPIFGVLDKNYIPSDVPTRQGSNYDIGRRSQTLDFDSVRKKAYENKETLEEDIKDNLMCENCEYLKKAKSCKKNKKDEDLMYDALCEKQEEDDITVDEAAENYFDYGLAYEKKQDIDPIYLEDNKEEVKIVNHAEEEKEKKKDIPPVKSSINILSTLNKSSGIEEEPKPKKSKEKDLELTDDLFNLIDSMYEERDD